MVSRHIQVDFETATFFHNHVYLNLHVIMSYTTACIISLINPKIAVIVKRLPKIKVDSNDIVREESGFLLVFCGDRSLAA